MHISSVKYITSSTCYTKAPEIGKPTFAFVGRSNVGKSSLINMILNWRIAKTSSTPGKTATINYFLINDNWYLVDLPGYGWAKVSHTTKQRWERMVKEYLRFSPPLSCVFLLIDIRHKPQKNDLAFAHWLLSHHIPFAIVFTKRDKINTTTAHRHTKAFQETLLTQEKALPPHFISSSAKKNGREALLQYISEKIHPKATTDPTKTCTTQSKEVPSPPSTSS